MDEFCLDLMYYLDRDALSHGFNGDFLRQKFKEELCLDYWYDQDHATQIQGFNGNFLRQTAGIKVCLDQASQTYNLFSRQAAVIVTHLVQASWMYGFNSHICLKSIVSKITF